MNTLETSVNIKETELRIMNAVNAKAKTALEPHPDNYHFYDAEDNNYICEIKQRRKYYPTKMIENVKLLRCCKLAQDKGKQFLYVVEDQKGIFVFNCSKLIQDIADLKADSIDCPKNTDFGGSKTRVMKDTFNLPEKWATKL